MNAPKVGEIVGLKVARVYHDGNVLIEGRSNGGWNAVIHPDSLHPLPPSLTPEAQAVLDAAVARLQAACSGTVEDLRIATITLSAVTDTYIASTLPPPKPVNPLDAVISAAGELRQAHISERARFGELCAAESRNASDLEHLKYEHECACNRRILADERWHAAVAYASTGDGA